MKQASSPLPRDLHVLSLPLALILSQDQTLRCFYIVSYIFLAFVCLDPSSRRFIASWLDLTEISCSYLVFQCWCMSGSRLSCKSFLLSLLLWHRCHCSIAPEPFRRSPIYALQQVSEALFLKRECKITTVFRPVQIFFEPSLHFYHFLNITRCNSIRLNFV